MFLVGDVLRLNWPTFRMGTSIADDLEVDALNGVLELRRLEE
jgi:hypothetical protein